MKYIYYAIGIHKNKDDDRDELFGHAPAEISTLLYHFLRATVVMAPIYLKVEVLGKRKREVRPFVPAKYNAFTTKRQIAKILDTKLSKRKELFVLLELLLREKGSYCSFPIYQ